MMGGIEPMQVGTNLFRWLFKSIQVDMPEENDNEGGLEEGAEEQSYFVDNPSLDLEATSNAYDGLAKLYRLQLTNLPPNPSSSSSLSMVGFCHRHIPTIFITDKFQVGFCHGGNMLGNQDADDDDDDDDGN